MDGQFDRFALINQRFNNFDQFAHITKMWDLDFRQIDSGGFKADVLQVASHNWQVSEAKFNRKLDQRGQSPLGLRTFGVLTQKSPDIIWHGRETRKNNMMVFPEDCELDSQTLPGFNVLTLSFSEELLFEVMDTLGEGKDTDLLIKAEVLTCDPIPICALQQTADRLFADLRLNAPNMNEDQILYEIEYEIPRAIILALASNDYRASKPSPRQRYITIKRVKEYLEEYSHKDITVRDLCKAAFVSERTLRYAFEDYFGISPKTFIKFIKLNRVHRELLSSEPSRLKISDVANKWGFWHMGQFAKDYRQLFGELPSETGRKFLIQPAS